MKTTPIIDIENPPHAAPVTWEQLEALGITKEDIEAGEKRGESTHVGPWDIMKSYKAIVIAQDFDDYYGFTKSTRLRVWTPRTMMNIRPCGYDIEGWVSLGGKKVSCFSSSIMFETPDGRLVDCAAIFVRL